MTDAERLKAAQTAHLERLREAVADRPAHADYLEFLLQRERGREHEEPLITGVSRQVADALQDDVHWIRRDPPEDPRANISGFPRAYGALRDRHAEAARKRAAGRGPGGLGRLLRLEDGSKGSS